MKLNLSSSLSFDTENHSFVIGASVFDWRFAWTKTNIGWWIHAGPFWFDYTDYGKVSLSLQGFLDEPEEK